MSIIQIISLISSNFLNKIQDSLLIGHRPKTNMLNIITEISRNKEQNALQIFKHTIITIKHKIMPNVTTITQQENEICTFS